MLWKCCNSQYTNSKSTACLLIEHDPGSIAWLATYSIPLIAAQCPPFAAKHETVLVVVGTPSKHALHSQEKAPEATGLLLTPDSKGVCQNTWLRQRRAPQTPDNTISQQTQSHHPPSARTDQPQYSIKCSRSTIRTSFSKTTHIRSQALPPPKLTQSL
jgi:hypothetical protein